MELFLSVVALLTFAGFFVLAVSYVCYRLAFFVIRRKDEKKSKDLLTGLDWPFLDNYEPYKEQFEGWINAVRKLPFEEVSTVSFDGLRLYGKFYKIKDDAPIELMFHGYRGSAERDLSGWVEGCYKIGHNALVVDQRSSGKSEGKVITFGINEHKDCLAWINFTTKHFGDDVKIILTGISMGASTVLMAAGCELPKNVIGVIADCGYSSARDIIKRVMRLMAMPADALYPFVRLGAMLYGKFDPDKTSPKKALRECHVPVIFFHGETDRFVPCEMSRINFDACASKKRLVTMPKAGHGLSYPVDPERYITSLQEFLEEVG